MDTIVRTARIVKRNDPSKSNDSGDLIIGKDLNGLLEKGVIYELLDYGLGDIIIRRLGPCSDQEFMDTYIPEDKESPKYPTIWNREIGGILCYEGHRVLMTNAELTKIINNDKTT